MWEEQIPSIGRISHVDAGKDGKEVHLEKVRMVRLAALRCMGPRLMGCV